MNNSASRVFVTLAAAAALTADDGIWLVNQFPAQRVRERYGFQVTPAFLDRLRSASVRLNNGGSGSFVSPEGLIFTNHHVASDCIQKLSTAQADYMKDGFLARSLSDEKPCPDLEVNSLIEIQDVTPRVRSAESAATGPEANRLRKAAMTAIEKECSDRTGDRCDVVTLYSGGLYHLYRYKKYTDIRLALAPEVGVAAFGGDPDNFTYPRYCLDFSFLRAYENGKPARTPHFFRWSKTGARDGELMFVSGHPGTTGRLATLPELEFARDVSYPFVLEQLNGIIGALQRYAARGPDEKRVSADNLFSMQNSFKAYTGFLGGLREADLMNRKRDEEQTLRASAKPEQVKVWSDVAAAYAAYRQFYRQYWLLESNAGRGSELFNIARKVYRYGIEKQKPDADRLREYVDPALPSLEQEIYSPAPITASMEAAVLANYLASLEKQLGAAHPLVRDLLGGKPAAEAADSFVSSSKIADVAERKRLAGDPEAAARSEDGMIRLVRMLEPEARRLRRRYDDNVESAVTGAAEKIAQVRFARFGTDDYPDATFTLRISYGAVKGYRNAQGAAVPWATDFAGMYRRATGVEPFALPPLWLARKNALRLNTPYDFVTTADTHGGNSGSPTVNRKGEVTGILFDGNLEGLPNRFVYREERERSVHVASQGIVEAMRKVYGATRLLAELGWK